MSSYLDFVIEKKDKDGKWKYSMKSSYDEDEAIVNPYILRDTFQFYLDVNNVTKFDDFETEIIMSEKFQEYYKDYFLLIIALRENDQIFFGNFQSFFHQDKKNCDHEVFHLV